MKHKLLAAKQIQHKMNKYGKLRLPYLFVIDYEVKQGFFVENPLEQDEILFRTPLGSNKKAKNVSNTDKSIEAFPADFEEYKAGFDLVMEGFEQGKSKLLNYTAKTPINCDLSLEEIFCLSDSLFELYVPNMFVSFSPERFVKIENATIATYPMKGTISTDIPDAREIILNDKKESNEHRSVVELLSDDLQKVAENVQVKRYRYIDEIATTKGNILQVSSEITGNLADDYLSRLGDIIFSMLPAGSIAGHPKEASLELIRQAEKDKRGFYSGVFGYFDGKNLDTGVLIRFIAQENKQYYFHSGGGITALSRAEKEYEELIQKIYLPS